MNAYQKYTKSNPVKMETERNRLKAYLNDKYKNNEEYRQKRIEYQRAYRERMKATKKVNIIV
jgi:hypothetical protein